MAYTKIRWKNHVVSRPRTYSESQNPDGTKTLLPAPGEIIQQGTPQNAENFNNFEDALQHYAAAFDWMSNLLNAVEMRLPKKKWDKAVADLVYPVGSIYMSLDSTSPASRFGGEWAPIKDVFLLGAGDNYAVSDYEQDGGYSEVTLSVSNMPSHNHNANTNSFVTSTYINHSRVTKGTTSDYYFLHMGNADVQRSGLASATANTGGNTAHENMPPYKTVYMWRRIA